MNYSNTTPSKPLTILHIAPIADSQISGIAVAVPKLLKVLHNNGSKVALLTSIPNERYSQATPYPIFHISDLPWNSKIASLPYPYCNPDLIIFHSTYILSHIAIAHEAIQNNIPYIIQPHGGMTRGAQALKRSKKQLGNRLFFNRIVQHAAAIHCLTAREASDVQEIWHKPVFVAGNGVDLPDISTLANPGQQPSLNFVFMGRFDIQHKGLDWLLEACYIIQDKLRQSNAQVFLYGNEVGDSRTKIKQLLENYQIGDLVHLKDPIWGEAAKRELFQSTDLFIHTSRFEGHPITVLEALSYGIPCLLTPGTNMATEVALAGAGWAVDDNPNSIAAGLDRILSQPEKLAIKGQAARNLTQAQYSWTQVGQTTEKAYKSIVMSQPWEVPNAKAV